MASRVPLLAAGFGLVAMWGCGRAFLAPSVLTTTAGVLQATRAGPRLRADSSPAEVCASERLACIVVALGLGALASHSARAGSCRARTALRATQDELKKQVGYQAVDDYVKSGTVIGLGTGSTAAFAVERVGEKLKSGELKDIIAIPTSIRTRDQAESLGIPLATLDTHSD